MFIAEMSRPNQAPLGATCSGRESEMGHMPLLTELEGPTLGPCFYKHVAPGGAFRSDLR